MNEIKNSALLEELIQLAKNIGDKENPPLTAERFLVAAIDRVQNTAGDSSNEMTELAVLLVRLVPHPAQAKEKLLAYIGKEGSTSFLDDLYMKKKLQVVRTAEDTVQKGEITAAALIRCITSDPSNAIRDALEVKEQPQENPETPKRVPSDAFNDQLTKMLQQKMQKQQETAQPAAEDAEIPPQQVPEGRQQLADSVKKEMATLVADVRRIRNELQSKIFGQDNAINVFTTGYFQSSLMSALDKSRKRPRATFLFAGPPGVGKTFLAESAAASLQLPFMRFDMSEYADKEAHLEFCGTDKVYKNGKSGNVTSFVEKNPKCVLLFDEIEKAHLGVIHLFLQMLDAGRLRDNFTDKEVSFKDAIIILTTNAGKQLYEEYEGDLSGLSRKVIVRALQKDVNPMTGAPFFPGAICSRFASGNVVMFNHIGAHNLRTIARKEINRHGENLEAQTGIHLEVDDQVYTALLLAEGGAADARTVRGRAETFFNDELYELLRMLGSGKVKTGIEDLQTIRVCLDLEAAPAELRDMFQRQERPKMLLLADPVTVASCARQLPEVDVIGVQQAEEAAKLHKDQALDLVVLDLLYGAAEDARGSLNVEDVRSPGRDFFRLLREQKGGMPVYLLEKPGKQLTEEERVSFLQQGVRGMLQLDESFAANAEQIAVALHQQASMLKLAKENKVLSFETAQTISADGHHAQICLFDLALSVAVDSEDAKNVLSAVSVPNVHFADVIGADDAKQELQYFVSYLKDPKRYTGSGVKAPKGVLLYGPPGTGKTMLAKAMACEAGVTFIAAEGNQFLKQYVGEGPEKVHELFRTARKYAPSILFVDEIDAIGKERRGAASSMPGSEETMTAFLAEMDGFANDPGKPVFVLAATNFDVQPGGPKSLDPALMRRFDRRVYIDRPDKEDRIRFLKMKLAKNPALEISDAQLDNIAMRSVGMSLAELDSVVELALRSAIREGSLKVTDAILEEALETFNYGEEKPMAVSQLERIARHEAGHAFLYWQAGNTPSYMTIVARGNHGGYMQHADQENKGLFTKEELLADIRTSLGGRAAEIVYYGPKDGVSTGASGDLANATAKARRLICSYGMDEDFGLAVVQPEAASSGEAMSLEVRQAVNRILQEQMEKALTLVQENQPKIDALVKALLVKNHMTGTQIDEILKNA